ncbi:MAG: magnetochrome domain-containing protein [Candidatus Omnitrophica bacterium]|nr:magnetochrome domain-containing protein [Candidatus Omnitrophota bacterium]
MVKKPQGKGIEKSFEEFMARFKDADLNTYFIFGAILLILIVGVYALFSPEAKNARQGNPACGMIVIATDGSALASGVATTLNEARYFLVVNPLSGKLVEAMKNPYRGPDVNTQLVYLIASKGEEAVIVGNIDQQSYSILMQFGIRVFGGYQGRAQKVVKLYRQARISASPQPVDNTAQTYVTAQTPQPMGNTQAAFGQPGQYMQGPGMNNSYCPIPNRMQPAGMPMNAVPAGAGMNQRYCPLPGRMQGMVNNFAQGTQAAFGWGQQAFVCPVCNWRMKAARQGNNFPTCPNCGASMALDMSNQNKDTFWSEGMWAANQTGINPQQYYQAPSQGNFGQGADINQPFLCPNCNWRMYSQQGMNEFPRCPNCGQVMARCNNNFQNQNFQNQNSQYNAAPNGYYGNGNFGNQVAMTQGTATQAPPITRDAMMPHAYRGVCSNCHQILDASAGVQNNAVNVIPNNQVQNVVPQQDPNSAHIAIGGK